VCEQLPLGVEYAAHVLGGSRGAAFVPLTTSADQAGGGQLAPDQQ